MSNFSTMDTLAKNIRRLMREKGMRQEDLARETKILRPNISRLLTHADANPQIRTIEAIASALGVTVCELLSEVPEKAAC